MFKHYNIGESRDKQKKSTPTNIKYFLIIIGHT